MGALCDIIEVKKEDIALERLLNMQNEFNDLRNLNLKISEELKSNEWSGAAPEGCLAAFICLNKYADELSSICDDLCTAVGDLGKNISDFASNDYLVANLKKF